MLAVATAVVVKPGPFLAIITVAAVASTLTTAAGARGLVVPVVVIDLVLGALIGQHGLGLRVDPFTSFFGDLGLALLFFFAGYELEIERIRGRPIILALLGWSLSLAIAYSIAGALAAAGVVLSLLFTGSALSTTALGTLMPILADSGELQTPLGGYTVAVGTVGELGPILLVTLALSATRPLHNALILLAFLAIAVGVGVLAIRSSGRVLPAMERTLEHSSQLAIRWILVLIFGLVMLAFHLGLDLLLGGFAAGVIAREARRGRQLPSVDSKLNAIAFGVFVPFFFIVSGMRLDLPALFSSPADFGRVLLFLTLFLVVRGAPALVLYGRELDRRTRVVLALFSSTQLPLVLAITALATAAGEMRSSTAAALVGAAVLSTLLFPALGLKLRQRPAGTIAVTEPATVASLPQP